jgi:methionine-rich copper-binding protein CopC
VPPRAPNLALLLSLLAAPAPAAAQAMRMVESSPAARTAMDGPGREVWVRFGAPVDHAGSRLLILRGDGEVVRTLRPRLNAAPDVLYAETGGLAPGPYVLRWEARPRPGGPVETGTLEFTVR